MLSLLQYNTWAISESFFQAVAPAVQQWLASGHGIDRFVNKKKITDYVAIIDGLIARNENEGFPPVDASFLPDVEMAAAFDTASGLPIVQSGNKNVAIIPLVGTLTKYGEACAYGMQDYQSMLAAANKSNTIDAIILMIDSPGGTTDGTQELATAVRDSAKPVGVFVDGLMASAAYWIGSQAQSAIVANKYNSNTIGSIGTYGIYQNISEKLAKEGVQMEIIRAKQSTKKIAANPIEPLSPECRAEMVDAATAINSIFINYVQTARPNVDAGVFDAAVYDTNAAKNAGLIDAVGTLQTAVNKVLETVRANNKLTQNNSTNSTMNILEFLGLSKEQKAKLSAEDQSKLDTLESNYSALEAKVSALDAEKVLLTAKVGELEASSAAALAAKELAESKVAELTAKLEAAPAGNATTAVAANDPQKKVVDPTAPPKTSVDAEVEEIQKRMAGKF